MNDRSGNKSNNQICIACSSPKSEHKAKSLKIKPSVHRKAKICAIEMGIELSELVEMALIYRFTKNDSTFNNLRNGVYDYQ